MADLPGLFREERSYRGRSEWADGLPLSGRKAFYFLLKKKTTAPRLTGKVHGMMDQLTQTAPWLPGREAKRGGFLF